MFILKEVAQTIFNYKVSTPGFWCLKNKETITQSFVAHIYDVEPPDIHYFYNGAMIEKSLRKAG